VVGIALESTLIRDESGGVIKLETEYGEFGWRRD
jgi:hypothetical protein